MLIVFFCLAGVVEMAVRIKPGNPARRSVGDLLREAQDLVDQAWETPSRKKRMALAKKALTISSNCADAYVVLAQATATLDEALELHRKGVEAGQRALGKRTFAEDVGYFWGILETRPYMRARAGLAYCLWRSKQHEEALEHYRELLRLNRKDNQGIRYVLAACLLELGCDQQLGALLKEHAADRRAYMMWTRALFAFRTQGDNPKSCRVLAEALESNPYVPLYLLELKPLPRALPDYTGLGDEREAMCWAAENINAWRMTNGALAWLAGRINAERPVLLH
jgi:tetratricopeptide (TPR) repeat protein